MTFPADDVDDVLAAREAEQHRDDPTVGMAELLATLFGDDEEVSGRS
ncbi:hypothetical protein [Streptomyces sp. NPDC055189]